MTLILQLNSVVLAAVRKKCVRCVPLADTGVEHKYIQSISDDRADLLGKQGSAVVSIRFALGDQ